MCFSAFAVFVIALLSLWIRKDPKIWGPLFALSLLSGWLSGLVTPTGFLFIFLFIFLWVFYTHQKKPLSKFLLFIATAVFSFRFLFEVSEYFPPLYITPHFKIGLATPLVGFFPFAFLIPLARSLQDFKMVMKGFLWGALIIALLAVAAIGFNVVTWQVALPSFAFIRYLSNFFLTSIPEEGFFRGFIQVKIALFLQKYRWGNSMSLFITSVLFTFTHIYWSPDLSTLIFVFLASLLYGGIYFYSGKIESAILTHFLLNITHMTLFSYHAL